MTFCQLYICADRNMVQSMVMKSICARFNKHIKTIMKHYEHYETQMQVSSESFRTKIECTADNIEKIYIIYNYIYV